MALGLIFAGLSAACASSPSVYQGTGSLQTSGASLAPTLASHTVVIAGCSGERVRDGYVDSFAVVALGNACIMDGYFRRRRFIADPGTPCSLRFADAIHTLRVTDVAVDYGVTQSLTGRTFVDPNEVQVELGGDDMTTGVHALYRFSGGNSDDAPFDVSCDDERLKHIARLPAALEYDAPEDRRVP